MREKNATSIEYFKDPRRIVDLLNGKRLIFRYDRKIPDYFSVAGAP